jgi:hypothetical protein
LFQASREVDSQAPATWVGMEVCMREKELTKEGGHQCSRLKPSYEFHLEGLSNFSPSIEGLVSDPRHQSKNVEMKYKAHSKLVHDIM